MTIERFENLKEISQQMYSAMCDLFSELEKITLNALMEGCMRNNKYQHSLNDAIRNSDFSCKNDTFYNLQELVDMYSFSTPEEREELEKRTIQRKARDEYEFLKKASANCRR